jgi:hypothetical protein
MKHYVILTMLVIFLVGCQNVNKTQEKGIITSANMCVPVTTDRDWYYRDDKAPLIEGLGDLHFTISAKDTLAQKYFNQGLALAYGFNHAEAARAFYYAIKIDDNCAIYGAMLTCQDPTIMPVWKVITTSEHTNPFRKQLCWYTCHPMCI